MKKRLFIAFVLVIVLALSACGSKSENQTPGSAALENNAYIIFRNDLNVKIEQIYIDSVTRDEWGTPVNESAVKSGKEISVSSAIFNDPNGLYGVGVTDQNGQNYDASGILLSEGDTISISGEGENAAFTVTTAAGESTVYPCIVFSE